jgi:phenylacetate-CoA ligase
MKKKLVKLRKKIFALLCWKQTRKANSVMQSLLINANGGVNTTQVEEFTQKHLTKLLETASNQCTYYKNIHSTNLADFPVIDKDIMRKNLQDFTDQKYPFYNTILFGTGGSTGTPFEFYSTRLAGYVDQRHQQFFHQQIGFVEGDKICSMGAGVLTDKMEKNNVYWQDTESKDVTYGSKHYSAARLDEVSLSAIVQDLNKHNPQFLRGYPSVINILAEYIAQNNITLQFQLKGVELTAENILPWQIKTIGNAFNTNVYGQYGHSEKCVYAHTNANSLQYFCSPFYGFVEVLDDQNQHVKIGETGRVVVTSYFSYATFFIRYDTGDLAEYGGIDERGWTIFNRIAGRNQDYIYDKNGNKVDITAALGEHLKIFMGVDKWQVVQSKIGEVQFNIVKKDNYTDKNENELKAKLLKMGFKTTFHYVDEIPLTPRGKYRFVVQNIEKNGE